MKATERFTTKRISTRPSASDSGTGRRWAAFGVEARPVASLVAVFAAAANISGCAAQGAPSYSLFGAYFPAWMFCSAIGLLAAVVARAVFEASGLAYVLPYQLFVCASIGVCAGLGAGLLWFEP